MKTFKQCFNQIFGRRKYKDAFQKPSKILRNRNISLEKKDVVLQKNTENTMLRTNWKENGNKKSILLIIRMRPLTFLERIMTKVGLENLTHTGYTEDEENKWKPCVTLQGYFIC